VRLPNGRRLYKLYYLYPRAELGTNDHRKDASHFKKTMYQIETKFRCRFFGYVELGLSLSEIPFDHRHKILKIAISKLCKTKIENNEEIEIPTAKDHFKILPSKKKSFFTMWKNIKNLKIEINPWNISIFKDQEKL